MDHAAGPSRQAGPASSRGSGSGPGRGDSPQNQQTTPKQGSDIVFITSDSTGSKEARQAIRRRAAQYSHKVGRKKPKSKQQKIQEREDERATTSADSSAIESSLPTHVLPVRESTPGTSSSTEAGSSSAAPEYSTSPSSPGDDIELVIRDEETTLHLPKDYITSVVLRRTLSDRSSITTSTYPVPGQTWFPQLLDYMWTWMETGWRKLENTTPEERASTLHWVQCVSMTEPAYFLMNLLSAADTLLDRGQIEEWKVIWLTGQVVKAINSALSDPVRMHSAGVILAVGRIALEEIVTGNREAGEKFHRPAQARLIGMAGGLDAIGLPSMVMKHVCWADRVVTRVTDVSLLELEPSVRVDTRPNFGPQPQDRDLELLNEYRPARHRTSRL